MCAWFRLHARDLPWRRSRDPYAIWVSEVMLQQTQAATVIAYFERFMQAFPSIAVLASADEQEVLRLWAGLGYYRRARDLLRAAQAVVREHAGKIPHDRDALQSLPGFGRYTANAVLSQAFDARLPIVEANSRRVLARFFGYADDLKSADGERWLWRTAAEILPRHGVGQFNQALMELGALVCTARSPACSDCPLAARCEARRLDLVEQIPGSGARKKIEIVHEVALVIRRAENVLLVRRPAGGRWGNMWEFPHLQMLHDENLEVAAERLAKALGLSLRIGEKIITLKHTVTRFRITLHCQGATWLKGKLRSQLYALAHWLHPAEIGNYPLSSPQRRLAERVACRDGDLRV